MEDARIATVLPTYNRVNLLCRAIRSIQDQTFTHFRIFVYDNASTDGTPEAVRELARGDARISYYRHPTNVGSVSNILSALQHVHSPLFHVLSDDDAIFPDFYAKAVTLLDRYPDAAFAAGGTIEATEEGAILFAPQSYWPHDGYFSAGECLDLMLGGFHPSWTTIVFRTRTLSQCGPPNPRLPNVFDLDFTARTAVNNAFALFREPAGVFLRHPDSGGDFADTSLIDQYELMAASYAAEPAAAEIRTQLSKRICQIATKQLLRGERRRSLDTIVSYHRRYARTPQTALVHAAAVAATIFPPIAAPLRAVDAGRRWARSQMSRAAAKRNGVSWPHLTQRR